jgi:hypothetical protein
MLPYTACAAAGTGAYATNSSADARQQAIRFMLTPPRHEMPCRSPNGTIGELYIPDAAQSNGVGEMRARRGFL